MSDHRSIPSPSSSVGTARRRVPRPTSVLKGSVTSGCRRSVVSYFEATSTEAAPPGLTPTLDLGIEETGLPRILKRTRRIKRGETRLTVVLDLR